MDEKIIDISNSAYQEIIDIKMSLAIIRHCYKKGHICLRTYRAIEDDCNHRIDKILKKDS